MVIRGHDEMRASAYRMQIFLVLDLREGGPDYLNELLIGNRTRQASRGHGNFLCFLGW